MRILIIEDQDQKRVQLRRFLIEAFPGADILEARSLGSGLEALLTGTFELVLVDMTMPGHDTSPNEPGGRPQMFAGREILDQMARFGIQAPTVMFTQYDSFGNKSLAELSSELQREHPYFYRGAVHYNTAVSGWKTALREHLRTLPGFQEPRELS